MNARHTWKRLARLAPAAAVLLLAGCGGGGASSGSDSARNAPADLNAGPKAVETVDLNPGLAGWGAEVFQKRACTTCHAIGERRQGPDLAGVAARRTEAWLKKQISDPEWMIKNDPIARQLFAEFALQMANQQVPEQEIRALLHFFVQEALENPESASLNR